MVADEPARIAVPKTNSIRTYPYIRYRSPTAAPRHRGGMKGDERVEQGAPSPCPVLGEPQEVG